MYFVLFMASFGLVQGLFHRLCLSIFANGHFQGIRGMTRLGEVTLLSPTRNTWHGQLCHEYCEGSSRNPRWRERGCAEASRRCHWTWIDLGRPPARAPAALQGPPPLYNIFFLISLKFCPRNHGGKVWLDLWHQDLALVLDLSHDLFPSSHLTIDIELFPLVLDFPISNFII